MKKLIAASLTCVCMTALAAGKPSFNAEAGQGTTSPYAHLTWATSSNAADGTVNVYRASGDCTGSPAFTAIKKTVAAAGPYDDSTITVPAGSSAGTSTASYCYRITAVSKDGTLESAPSNAVAVQFTSTVLPQAPSGLAGSSN